MNLTYAPPQTMPASTSVTITAFLVTQPSVSVSYKLKLINPIPQISAVSPTQLLTGGTQGVNVYGSGFVSNTTVTLAGASVAATYIYYGQLWVQIPVAGNATGTLPLLIQNPGVSQTATLSESIAPNSIEVTTGNLSGTNPSLALGTTVNFSANVAGSMQTAVNWSVAGAGSISSSGSYTAPTAMPSNPQVNVLATLASNNAIVGAYSLVLKSPVPSLIYLSPGQAVAGATVPITFFGSNFVPGIVILANNVPVPTTYQSSTSVTAQITAPPGSTSNISLVAQNPSPTLGVASAFTLGTAAIQLSATNPNGSGNNGQAVLGVPISLDSESNSQVYTTMAWQLQGAGTLTPGGGINAPTATYTPPLTMPVNGNVTIEASMYYYPVLTTSYALTLVNPLPAVISATPSHLLTGGTQTVKLVGSGFVPGTTVAYNGTTLPITYVDYNDATVQIPVAANATGALALQIQNPSPGGGAGATFTETVATPGITLTATDPDGTNTGTAELGVSVAVTPVVTGSAETAVTWSMASNSAGTLSSNGVYTAPTILPVSTQVTVMATLASNPAVTASYVLNIINPAPVLAAASPAIVPAGGTTVVTLTGSNIEPGTVIQVNGVPLPTTYLSPSSIQASVTVAPSATGSVLLQAYTGLPGGGSSNSLPVAISAGIGATEAARILDQATFGPTTSLIQQVQQEGVNAWLAQQFNTPSTVMPIIPAAYPSYCNDAEMCFESEWWDAVLTGNDQLRQRVAFTLSEMFVVSSDTVLGQGIDSYANMLANDAFSNWYTIMNDVTLSPAMGLYLNMVDSFAPYDGLIANENYARECMQLFNLGLNLLNPDGSQQLDGNGNPIPTFSEAQVQAFARAYTGWTFSNPDGSTPSSFLYTPYYYHPMVAVEEWHDEDPKTLLSGTVLPAGQTAEQDLAGALNNIFQHPNLPPFVCQQLIQHLVKSDPSPAYVSRVAAVFVNDGNGVRGDMQAVLTAILTDPEARAGDTAPQPSDGHLREPILWLTAVMRGLGYTNIDPNNFYQPLSNYTNLMNEVPFLSPSVFNFFPPSYVVPGTALNAPEFALENTASVPQRLAVADYLVNNFVMGFNVDLSATSPLGQLAANPSALVNELDALFTHSQMDAATKAAIVAEVVSISDAAQRVRIATYLVISSSAYKVLG